MICIHPVMKVHKANFITTISLLWRLNEQMKYSLTLTLVKVSNNVMDKVPCVLSEQEIKTVFICFKQFQSWQLT